MTKPQTLRLNKEFRTLYYHGKSQVHPLLITYARKNRLGVCRYGITTGKKLGKAVQRNRCRRIIREAFRKLSPGLTGVDLVFVARSGTTRVKSADIERVMKKQLQALSLLK